MNIAVKHECAPPAIGRIVFFPDNMCMVETRHYLREWREHRNKTLVQVAEYLHMTHGTLSKIERGKVPYNQRLLEALSELYMCDPADLIMRNPKDSAAIWSLWDRAVEGDKRKIVAIVKTIVEGDGKTNEAA